MDTGLLNLEEHFSTYNVYDENDDQSSSDDNNRGFFNEWEDERELNGDIGLIPEPSSFCASLKDMSEFTDSPPSMLFQKMIDWSTFIYGNGVDNFPHESLTSLPDQEIEQKERNNSNDFDNKELNSFDLALYIDTPDSNKETKKFKSVGKRIDKNAQKYIIEENDEKLDTSEEIDVETVSEGTSFPVLEANDAYGLLEQFEASEKPILSIKASPKLSSFGFTNANIAEIESNPIEIIERIPETPIDIFENNTKVEQKPVSNIKPEPKKETKPQTSESATYPKNKQILEALPQELIARINESGKRKPITVIPPIPNKKRSQRTVDVTQPRNKIQKLNNEQIRLDHDYCAAVTVYPKEPRKDSGFQSEEDDRSVIRNQPTVKTADGKLMVSLLKVNTIRNNAANQKKKLNLEEYKKRRFIGSNATSLSNSPISSTCSSPSPEDENLKRIKHQEKLMKMAAELLNTPSKSSKGDLPAPKFITQKLPQIPPVPQKIVPPPDLEVKTYVSVGTNTDISSINSSKTLIASTQQLEEIKPLLKKVSDKINSNSFITSLIENIPKAKTKVCTYVKPESQETVREDKIIHYLKKDREPVKTKDMALQTDFDDVDTDDDSASRYRRRLDVVRSPSTSSSGRSSRSTHRRRRTSSNSSRSSSSSTSSRSSRSRSRSISSKRSRNYSVERLREVEERRVIYVGRITNVTTKEDLRRRFMKFGPITNVSLHFRDYGDNYGFVTFANKEDAYEAVEHGNDHAYPKYDLSFGGRRIFCKTSYSDLDNMREDDYASYYSSRTADNSFDALLRAAQEKLRKRKP